MDDLSTQLPSFELGLLGVCVCLRVFLHLMGCCSRFLSHMTQPQGTHHTERPRDHVYTLSLQTALGFLAWPE